MATTVVWIHQLAISESLLQQLYSLVGHLWAMATTVVLTSWPSLSHGYNSCINQLAISKVHLMVIVVPVHSTVEGQQVPHPDYKGDVSTAHKALQLHGDKHYYLPDTQLPYNSHHYSLLAYTLSSQASIQPNTATVLLKHVPDWILTEGLKNKKKKKKCLCMMHITSNQNDGR